MKRAILIFLVLILSASRSHAERDSLAAHMLKGIIDINASYHGERLFLYGVTPENCDIIVTVMSGSDTLHMRSKGKRGPLWLNVGNINFVNWRRMYKIKSTKPLDEIIPKSVCRDHLLGYDAIKESTEVIGTDNPNLYLDQLLALSIDERLYSDWEDVIQIYPGGLFDASFYWPSKAKIGDYKVDVYAVRDGQIIGHVSEIVNVEKIGIEQWLSNHAENGSLVYGLMCVVVAVFAGGLVSLISRGILYFISLRKSIRL